eukprot:TRINITY_DN6747_c0_g1_i1.p3 TRINITY_DN6747_c0_g1~~TRINITY_DN6747_c0_g1_i1.p3  ORF type:complete len:147 (-),score=51.88 TRINITY_DN6747_c0_g1_i1:387-827(-)
MPETTEVAPAHFSLDQKDPDVQFIAQHIPWYGPAYSPHAVPSFYDVSGIIETPAAFRKVVDLFVARYRVAGTTGPTAVAGFEARGFLFGVPVALELGLPFVMLRKAGKVPGVVASAGAYTTEYSRDQLVLRLGAVGPGTASSSSTT